MHERDLFTAALEIDDESARQAYLDEACAGDSALRSRVERLLIRAGEAGDFLDQPAADLCSDLAAGLLIDASESTPELSDPATITGNVGDTGKTILEDPAVSSASASRTSIGSTSRTGSDQDASALGTLFGRYRVERVLGSGGMGVVYLAEDLRLGRRVALKIPRFDADDKFHLSQRFRREARTMASVLHRNLCPIFDVDEQEGTHFLTMAFIDGEPLSQLLKRGETFTSRQIAELIRKLALALDEAHRAGVVHRDLKPANVMIDRGGEPILMDFGLAWMVHEADARVTQSGAIVGTPAYMSPEQAEGDAGKVGALSDIYSLGAILYELLTGRPIHTGGVTRVLFKLVHEVATRPSEIRGEVDPILESICWKAISRRPADRFATAADFAMALTSFLEQAPTGKLDVIPDGTKLNPRSHHVVLSDGTDVLSLDNNTVAYSPPKVVSSRRWRIALASLLLVGSVGFGWRLWPDRALPQREDFLISQSQSSSGDRANSVSDGSVTASASPGKATPAAPPKDFELHFDPSTVVQVESLKLESIGPHTQEAWVTPANQDLTKSSIHVFGRPQGSSLFLDQTSGGWAFGLTLDDGFRHIASKPIQAEQRVHVAVVRADQEMRLFVGGQMISRGEVSGRPMSGVPLPFLIGTRFTGRMDEIRVSTTARYAQDFKPRPRFEPDDDTLALYHCDEESGVVLKDASGHGHHGRISGPAIWRRVSASSDGQSITAPLLAKAPFVASKAKTHQEEWAGHLGILVESSNSIGMKLVLIPPGEFQMGSTDEQVAEALQVAEEINAESTTKERLQKVERPQHRVVITKPFGLSATEVTIGQFKKLAAATGFRTEAEKLAKDAAFETYLTPGYPVTDDSPAAVITWNDAVAFCQLLSDREQVTYRLPTEAEWEYACRAGTTSQYSFGDDHRELVNFGWFKENSENRSQEVRQKLANAFGLHDMHGNLWEWCQDFYDENWYEKSSASDPTGPVSGTQHVIRGGYWPASKSACRSAHRGRTVPFNRSNHFGFRVVREFNALRQPQAARSIPITQELAAQLPIRDERHRNQGGRSPR